MKQWKIEYMIHHVLVIGL